MSIRYFLVQFLEWVKFEKVFQMIHSVHKLYWNSLLACWAYDFLARREQEAGHYFGQNIDRLNFENVHTGKSSMKLESV